MDTQNQATMEIPNFKLAKVGKDRERRRGAAGWLNGGRGAGSAFGGATGGFGAGGLLGAEGGLFGLSAGLTKALLILLSSAAICAGAWQYGKMMSAKYNADQAGSGKKVFADKSASGKYDDLSGVIKEGNSIPNSLGYVSGSMDGLTPEERAKKAAEAEAARKAAEEVQKKADEEAAKQAAATPPSSPVDVNALAQAANAKAGLGSGKFGQFASGFGGGGGGLSGGSGLSGGIGRNFGGASDMGSKAKSGAMSAFRTPARASSVSASRAPVPKSNAKGFAKRQLANAITQSSQATAAGQGETAATSAAAPFDNNPGAGNAISGPGVGNTAGGTPGTGSTPNTTNPSGSSTSNGSGSSGASCQSGYAVDANGNCQQVATSGSKNSASYQGLIDTAKILMAVVAVLALIAIILDKLGYLAAVAAYIKYVIMAIGAVIMGLGVAILAQSGDMMIGGIVTAVGVFTIGSAFLSTHYLSNTSVVSDQAAGVLISNALGSLATSAASKSQLS